MAIKGEVILVFVSDCSTGLLWGLREVDLDADWLLLVAHDYVRGIECRIKFIKACKQLFILLGIFDAK